MANKTASGLIIDLSAIRQNYKTICNNLSNNTTCSAVVKSDAYGLGMAECSLALHEEGCNFFWVASLDEALKLKSVLQNKADITIAILQGLHGLDDEKTLDLFASLKLIPVLNSLNEVEKWQATARRNEVKYPAILHIDTGMHRLGMNSEEFKTFLKNKDSFENIIFHHIISHLSSADDINHIATEQQYKSFEKIISHFPDTPVSLANSAGIFNNKKLHYDLVRSGAAIYGLKLHEKQPKMLPAMFLNLPIIAINTVNKGDTIGYNATYSCDKAMTIATVPIGYADGYPLSLSNKGSVYCHGDFCPVIGRISMDLITIDVTKIKDKIKTGDMVEIIGENITVNYLAEQAGTIGYEILTSLGKSEQKQFINQ